MIFIDKCVNKISIKKSCIRRRDASRSPYQQKRTFHRTETDQIACI